MIAFTFILSFAGIGIGIYVGISKPVFAVFCVAILLTGVLLLLKNKPFFRKKHSNIFPFTIISVFYVIFSGFLFTIDADNGNIRSRMLVVSLFFFIDFMVILTFTKLRPLIAIIVFSSIIKIVFNSSSYDISMASIGISISILIIKIMYNSHYAAEDKQKLIEKYESKFAIFNEILEGSQDKFYVLDAGLRELIYSN